MRSRCDGDHDDEDDGDDDEEEEENSDDDFGPREVDLKEHA